MRYYVASDIHSYFSELKAALNEQGYFTDKSPHQLVLCGDLFDRGSEALALQAFILDLMSKNEVILIKGNHEDLAMQLLNEWHKGSYLQYHHHTNKTIDTVCQLTNLSIEKLFDDPKKVGHAFLQTPYIQKIIPAMIDYYETEQTIFTHGWIPCIAIQTSARQMEYTMNEDWRLAGTRLWNEARWINGMEAAHQGVIVPEKTIVCGHWHCSYGHSHYENDGGEFDHSPNFTPYYGKGIIAIDACTAVSKKVNCIVIED